jgi:hypothetical protein
MACGACAAAAARRAGLNQRYKWTGVDKDGNLLTVVYDTEMQAKAKVLRKGGSYEAMPVAVGG